MQKLNYNLAAFMQDQCQDPKIAQQCYTSVLTAASRKQCKNDGKAVGDFCPRLLVNFGKPR